MATSMSEYIQVTYKEGLQIIKINRPQQLNAINQEMGDALLILLDYGSKSHDVKFTVLTGEGKFFSSGNDFVNLEGNSSQSVYKFRTFCDVLIDYPKILVAVVNGPAIGMFFTMLALFDIVYAAENAYFLAPFSKIGLSAECCSSLLFPKIFGQSKAMEIMSFSHKLTSQEALHYGFIVEVLTEDQLKYEIWNRLIGYTKLSINSMIVSKKLVRDVDRKLLHTVNEQEAQALINISQSDDTKQRLFKIFQSKV